jgi:hypothetical protein
MAFPVDRPGTIVLKTRRDTLALVVAATAVTFALASTVHSRHPVLGSAPPERWTGELADVAPAVRATNETREILTSASLVVPKADLSLPSVPVRALVRLRGCDGSICAPRTTVPTPVPRPVLEASNPPAAAPPDLPAPMTPMHRAKTTFLARLNPMRHMPDLSTFRRPFTVAGNAVSGWFGRF